MKELMDLIPEGEDIIFMRHVRSDMDNLVVYHAHFRNHSYRSPNFETLISGLKIKIREQDENKQSTDPQA